VNLAAHATTNQPAAHPLRVGDRTVQDGASVSRSVIGPGLGRRAHSRRSGASLGYPPWPSVPHPNGHSVAPTSGSVCRHPLLRGDCSPPALCVRLIPPTRRLWAHTGHPGPAAGRVRGAGAGRSAQARRPGAAAARREHRQGRPGRRPVGDASRRACCPAAVAARDRSVGQEGGRHRLGQEVGIGTQSPAAVEHEQFVNLDRVVGPQDVTCLVHRDPLAQQPFGA
jgi:hypothetical protein